MNTTYTTMNSYATNSRKNQSKSPIPNRNIDNIYNTSSKKRDNENKNALNSS